jgi:L-seryl-tRNA(Ser) seleniumtransferase
MRREMRRPAAATRHTIDLVADDKRASNADDPRRRVPRTDALLDDPALATARATLGRALVKQTVTQVQARIREGEIDPDDAIAATLAALPTSSTSLKRVLNATGTVLHTNLGRAALSDAAVDALAIAAGATDVELDLQTNTRGRRGRGALEALAAAVPAAEDVHVVNNGAAALFLTAAALASGREILISRGELVEIGDGFRIPELLESSGARLREVGTTNRTSLRDYADATGPDTAFILKVHPSNFTVEGFTSSATIAELKTLRLPVVADIGSGLLNPEPLLPNEPDATTTLNDGASLVTASGDKLLGGPQCGLLLGDREIVQKLRRFPAARALRVDKLTLAALEATLRGPKTPTAQAIHADPATLKSRAQELCARLKESGVPADVVESAGVVGGGGAPGVKLNGSAVALSESLADQLRHNHPPIVGRTENGRLLLDLRCINPADDTILLDAVLRAAG